jgi:predicted secreted Zn-dependent protease
VNWVRSSRCHTSSCCVEVARNKGHVLVRQSDQPDTVVSFTEDEWRVFLAGVRDGEFGVS